MRNNVLKFSPILCSFGGLLFVEGAIQKFSAPATCFTFMPSHLGADHFHCSLLVQGTAAPLGAFGGSEL